MGPEPSVALPVAAPGSKKRGGQDLVDLEVQQKRSPSEAVGMDQDLVLPTFGRVSLRKAEKRSASEEPPNGEEFKQQRIGDSPLEAADLDMSFMEAMEDAEKRTLHIAS